MQTIKHAIENLYPIFTEFDKAYAHTSSLKKNYLVEPTFDPSFRDLFEMFSSYGYPNSVKYVAKHFTIGKLPSNSRKTIIICFSGGKDSIATTKHYLDRGYRVYLYHLQGINQTYRDEFENAKKAAEYLGVPIFFDKVWLSGSHDFVEHPMKNMIIANGAIQYGIREGIGTSIAFGNYTTSSLEDDNFEICGGDDVEMWEVYKGIVGKIIPGFEVHRVLKNVCSTQEVFYENPELLEYAQSCIGPYRYRNYLHDNNERKYGIKLPGNHCGSCWKCCLEYCVFSDKGIYEYNKEFYQHCLECLQRTLRQETGKKHTMDEVWNHYFFYGKEESKFYA